MDNIERWPIALHSLPSISPLPLLRLFVTSRRYRIPSPDVSVVSVTDLLLFICWSALPSLTRRDLWVALRPGRARWSRWTRSSWGSTATGWSISSRITTRASSRSPSWARSRYFKNLFLAFCVLRSLLLAAAWSNAEMLDVQYVCLRDCFPCLWFSFLFSGLFPLPSVSCWPRFLVLGRC